MDQLIMQLVTQFINIINELIYRASHWVESNGTIWNGGDGGDGILEEGAEDDEFDDLVGGDDPEVVEGTPGCLLPGYQLVLTSPIAHSNLYGQIFIGIFLNSPKSDLLTHFYTYSDFFPKRKSDNAKFNDSNKVLKSLTIPTKF